MQQVSTVRQGHGGAGVIRQVSTVRQGEYGKAGAGRHACSMHQVSTVRQGQGGGGQG